MYKKVEGTTQVVKHGGRRTEGPVDTPGTSPLTLYSTHIDDTMVPFPNSPLRTSVSSPVLDLRDPWTCPGP